MSDYKEKFEKERFRLPSYYFVVAAILSAVFFFMLLDYFKAYHSKVSFFLSLEREAVAHWLSLKISSAFARVVFFL